MPLTKAQKMLIAIAIIAVIGISVGGCQEKPEKYTGPVEKITVAAAERFIKSVLEAQDYVKDNSEEAEEFVKDRFDYESDYIDYSWPNQEFAVCLEQAMLITLEAEAR